MEKTEIALWGMQWLAENSGAIALVALAVTPLVAVVVVGYALHVVKQTLTKGERP
jgi:hypothetical protein